MKILQLGIGKKKNIKRDRKIREPKLTRDDEDKEMRCALYSSSAEYGQVTKFTLEQAMKAQRGSRGIALLFL
jgi:hypothetical protein